VTFTVRKEQADIQTQICAIINDIHTALWPVDCSWY